ncbi:hypothetical protein [Microcystis phage Mwe-JY25]
MPLFQTHSKPVTAMAERPIPFIAPMVRAILDGRKTQTRRVLKGYWQQTLEGHDRVKTWFAPSHIPKEGIPNQWAQSGIWAEKWGPRGYNRFLGFCPYRPGDRLWVREAWRTWRDDDELSPTDIRRIWQEMPPEGDHDRPDVRFEADGAFLHGAPRTTFSPGRLRAGRHLLREFSRITLAVTQVRVERLQDISEADAIAEGPGFVGKHSGEVCESVAAHRLGGPRWRNARDWYADLWDSIHRPGAWDANPWVCVISFNVLQPTAEHIGRAA